MSHSSIHSSSQTVAKVQPFRWGCPSERWWRLKVKVSSRTCSGFVRTLAEGTNDSSANEPNRRCNSLSTLEYSTITVFGRAIVLLLLKNYFYCICKLLFFCTPFQWPIKSLRTWLLRAALAFSPFCRLCSPITCPSVVVFFVPPDFLIYVKLGLVGLKGTLLVFLFIYPQNRKLSSLQSSSLQRTASRGLWTVSALLLCLCGLQAQVQIKVFICFTVGSDGIFFPPTVAGSYPTAAVSVRSSQCFGRGRWCRDLKRQTRANPHCAHYLFTKSLSLIGSKQSNGSLLNGLAGRDRLLAAVASKDKED